MRRNRFDDISDLRDDINLSGLQPDNKVRATFERLTGGFKQADVAKDINIDETMIPCFFLPFHKAVHP